MIVDYIDAHRHRFGVDPICTVLTEHDVKIAPSTYYAAKARGPVSDTDWADAHAANIVHQLYLENRRLYGIRKLWHAMKHAGHDVGRDQVGRLMRLCGITGAVRGKRRTITTATSTHTSSTSSPRVRLVFSRPFSMATTKSKSRADEAAPASPLRDVSRL